MSWKIEEFYEDDVDQGILVRKFVQLGRIDDTLWEVTSWTCRLASGQPIPGSHDKMEYRLFSSEKAARQGFERVKMATMKYEAKRRAKKRKEEAEHRIFGDFVDLILD